MEGNEIEFIRELSGMGEYVEIHRYINIRM